MFKFLKIIIFLILVDSVAFCQQNNSEAQQFSNIKKTILQNIDQQSKSTATQNTTKLKTVESRLNKNKTSVSKNNASSSTNNSNLSEMSERVELLELRHKLLEEIEWSTFEANVQTAVINLFAMDKQLKPLQLFDQTRIAFTQIGELSNLMDYPGYKEWFQYFSQYVSSNKNKESILGIVQTILNSAGAASGKLSLAGPMVQPVLSAIGMFIGSLGSGKAELKKKSEEMFLITTKAAQIRYDLQGVEAEWKSISEEMQLQKTIFTQNVDYVLQTLKLDKNDYLSRFYKSNDPTKVMNYYESVKTTTSQYLKNIKETGSHEWKNQIGYQLDEVQDLKISFGTLLHRISENLEKYEEVLKKYNNDPQLGIKTVNLNKSIQDLKNSFESNFSASEYINEARRMYKIY
ncbi:MAG: hypothetical protein HOP11_08440 [Saprospiraceae bacterium]|nr:hypothetical protein [Saprospiraceae bacterium]